jgi:hypothetical protein
VVVAVTETSVYFDSGMTRTLRFALQFHIYISSSAIGNTWMKLSWVCSEMDHGAVSCVCVCFFATGSNGSNDRTYAR